MEWIGTVILAIIIIAITFEIFVSVAAVLGKIARWIFRPTEWFGRSLLLWGSFRPRARTVLPVLFILLVACALLLFLLITTHSEWLGIALMCAALFIPQGSKMLWAFLRELEHAAVQVKRDKRAHQLKSALASRKTPPDFSLYLRPFDSTNHIRILTFYSNTELKYPGFRPRFSNSYEWRKTSMKEHEKTEDLETLLAMALDSYAPLIALGRPGEQVGAGRILTTEERWREDFRELADAARLILLIPSSNPGTAWELESVLSDWGLLSKTVFLIPPLPPSRNPVIHSESAESFRVCAEIVGSRNRITARADADIRQRGLRRHNPLQKVHATFTALPDSLRTSSLPYRPWFPSSGRKPGARTTSGLAFRWDQSKCEITFSAPLIIYAQPPPLRFLVDLWFSRETVVVSLWRLKRNLLSVVECDSQVKNSSATTIRAEQ